MLRSRVAAVAGTVCLVLGAASCGNGGEENGPFDAGLSGSDAGQASDAGQQLDGGVHEPDAGGNDEPDGGDVIPPKPLLRACGSSSIPEGTNISVMVDGEEIDFSDARFAIEYFDDDDPDYQNFWAYWVKETEDGNLHYLEVDIYGGFTPPSCPASVVFPSNEEESIFFGVSDENETYSSWGDPTGTGTLVIDSFNGLEGSRSLSFRCEDCLLGDWTEAEEPPVVTLSGSAFIRE